MKIPIRSLTILATLFVLSCGDDDTAGGEEHDNAHEVIIADYQTAQLEFKKQVQTIRDTSSYDIAAPKLEAIVDGFDRVAANLETLVPPNAELAEFILGKIEQGNKAAEPTAEDMMNLISVEDREEEVQAWLEEFASSGQRVGTQFARLYSDNKNKQKWEQAAVRKPSD